MSRPLTCDKCNAIIDSVVSPIKVVLNGPVPEELQKLTHDELISVTSIARQMGATSPVPQTFLDFCSGLCLALWAWNKAVPVPMSVEAEPVDELDAYGQ